MMKSILKVGILTSLLIPCCAFAADHPSQPKSVTAMTDTELRLLSPSEISKKLSAELAANPQQPTLGCSGLSNRFQQYYQGLIDRREAAIARTKPSWL